MTSQKANFGSLDQLAFELPATTDFGTLTEWMDHRFDGLPLFHRSIHLQVDLFEKVVQNEGGALEVPEHVFKRTSPHLKKDLDHLMAHIQRDEGIKSFGLLHLSVKLVSENCRETLEKQQYPHKSIPRFLQWMGSKVKVPIVLAVASRKTQNHYESLAVGLRGLGHYRSSLTVGHSTDGRGYAVKAGLEAQVSCADIDHLAGKILAFSKGALLPPDFFDTYLQDHLMPEREHIVKTLCEYVFRGCRSPGEVSGPTDGQQWIEATPVPCLQK